MKLRVGDYICNHCNIYIYLLMLHIQYIETVFVCFFAMSMQNPYIYI